MISLEQTTHERPSILIIDDVPANLDVLVANLREENMELTVALSGEDGIRLAKEIRPDLILLDIMMPGIDGYETAKILKAHQATADIPIVFLSAKDQDYDIELGLKLGAVDYISKPFSIPILKARLRNHLALQQKSKLLVQLACTDELTRVSNRRHFDYALGREWARSQRSGEPLSVVMLDVDYFKRYNDHYGHPEGDRCLKQVSRALSTVLMRPADLLARYGGEEFVVLLPETDISAAESIAEKMRHSVEALRIPHRENDASDWVTVSMGVSSYENCSEHAKESLITQADQALYQAKKSGRNKIVLHQDEQFWQASAAKQA